jgi:hypothetical protein
MKYELKSLPKMGESYILLRCGSGRSVPWTKWVWTKCPLDEVGPGRSGSWAKWVLDEVGLDEVGLDEVGLDEVGPGRSGSGRSVPGRSGGGPIIPQKSVRTGRSVSRYLHFDWLKNKIRTVCWILDGGDFQP